MVKEKKQQEIVQTISERFNIAKDNQRIIFSNFVEYYEYYRGSHNLKDGDTWKSGIHVPYIKQIIDNILPRMVSSRPKVNVLPREEGDVESAQQNEKLVNYQWERMKMYEIVKGWVKLGLMYGVGVVKLGWDFSVGGKDSPWVEKVSPYDFFISPGATNIDDASYVIFKQERDLESLKKNSNYKNLDKLEFALSQDNDQYKEAQRGSLSRSTPRKDKNKNVVVYEYYGKLKIGDKEEDYFVVLANNEIILRLEKLEEIYPCGKPFVAFHDERMPLDFWSIGEIEPLIPMQDELDTLRNQRIDNRNLIINHMWLVNKNAGIEWEDFVSRPGGTIACDDVSAVKPLPVNDTTSKSVEEEAIIKQDMDRTSGVFPGMMGQLQNPVGGGGNINQTARGFLASIEQAGTKMQYKLDNLDDALRELGQKLLKLNAKYIDEEQRVRIVGKSGVKFEKISVDDIKKEYDLRVEGGSTQPQNKETRLQRSLELMNIVLPYAQMPMFDYEPGETPVQTQLNVKYFIENILDQADLPNREEAFISQQKMVPPPMSGMDMMQSQPELQQMYGQNTGQLEQPQGQIASSGPLPPI